MKIRFTVALVTCVSVVAAMSAGADPKKGPTGVPTSSAPSSTRPAASTSGMPTPARPPVPGALISIPAGSFAFTSEDRQGNKTKRKVTVAAFDLEVTEVTVAAFKACVDAKVCDAPEQDKDGAEDGCTYWKRDKQPSLPVNCVSDADASKYCTWIGRRLPTELEWEYAATGTDGRTFPWGSTAPVDDLCWSGGKLKAGTFTYRKGPCSTGTFAGDSSPFGVKDMAANLREWVDPAVGSYAYQRGGSFEDNVDDSVKPTTRNREPAQFGWDNAGFRCAKTSATASP